MPGRKRKGLTVVEMARMGVRARARKTTPEQRTAIARVAARARWAQHRAKVAAKIAKAAS